MGKKDLRSKSLLDYVHMLNTIGIRYCLGFRISICRAVQSFSIDFADDAMYSIKIGVGFDYEFLTGRQKKHRQYLNSRKRRF
jgi:hypothetical protein